jgi:hypothetical protein
MDLADKIQKASSSTYVNTGDAPADLEVISLTPTKPSRAGGRAGKKSETGKFDKIITDSERISSEEVHGLLTQVLKNRLFNGVRYVKGGQVLTGNAQMGNMEMVES